MLSRRSRRELGRHALIYAALAPFLLVALFPVFWIVITAFKQEADLYRMDQIPFWFHQPPTLQHFETLFMKTFFGRLMLNTGMLMGLVVLITLVAAVPAGYVLARLRLPGSQAMGTAIFITYLVPPIILFIPLARVVGILGLFDSWWSLVVVYPTFTIPFCTWLLAGFFKTLPPAIEEAAWVDGCGLVSGIRHVVVPLSWPGLVIATIFACTLSLNEVLYAVVYVGVREEKTITAGISALLIRGDIFDWGALMSAAILVGVPAGLMYLFFIDHFIRSITGAVND